LKVGAVGSKPVGKTSFLIKFLEGSFPEDGKRAVFDSHSYEAISGKHEVSVELYDVRSELVFSGMKLLIFFETYTFVIFYSVTDRERYLDVDRLWELDAQTHCPCVPILPVAPTTDLRY
jgi:GTPase SAR1 family protein